jgi:putative RNA 2'-phosphotransferase
MDREPNTDPAVQDDDPVVLDDEHRGRLSRFLALVLRHRAYQFDLRVDDEGFVSIPRLLDVIRDQRSLGWVTRDHLEQLVEEQNRTRFEIDEDAIRATYGHSFRRPIQYPAVDPPEHLFVGLTRNRASEARTAGLKPFDRQYVHLSITEDEALKIARQHDPHASSITVKANEAARNGIQFHHPTEGIYLAARIPAEYLEVEVQFGRAPKKGRRRRP